MTNTAVALLLAYAAFLIGGTAYIVFGLRNYSLCWMRNNMPPKEHKINLPDGFGTLTIYDYSRTLEDMKNEYEAKEPYIPRIGDTVQLQGKICKIHAFNICTVEVQEKYELIFKASSLTLISRAPRFARTLTKAEAEKLLSEKLGEEVSIE